MKYILKKIDTSIRQSNDRDLISNTIEDYENFIKYLEAFQKTNDPEIIKYLVRICYTQVPTERPEEDEELTMDRILNDTEVVRNEIHQLYLALKAIIENSPKQTR